MPGPLRAFGKVEVIPEKYWRLDLGRSQLHYFINTTDKDVVEGNIPEEL